MMAGMIASHNFAQQERDYKERFANRFVRAPAGWAYAASDGFFYPLSEAEAVGLKQEGIAQLESAFARQKFGHFLTIAGVFFGALLVASLSGQWVGRGMTFLLFAAALAHGYVFHRFTQDCRQAELIVERTAKKRQALSPVMGAQLKRTNPFRIPAYTAALAGFLAILWLSYRTTGHLDPLMAGGAIDIAAHKGHWAVIFGLLGLSAILYQADRWWERRLTDDATKPYKQRKRSKELF